MNRRTALLTIASGLALAACEAERSTRPVQRTSRSSQPSQTQTSQPRPSTPAALRFPSPAAYADAQPTQFGMHLPGITDFLPTQPPLRTLALTFDACGGEVDHALVDTLRELRVPATLFLAGPWIKAHPDFTRELANDPLFQLENHGARHLPLSVNGQHVYGTPGTASPAEAIQEVAENAETLRAFGVNSTWFRAATAHYDDIAVRILADSGARIAGFATNGDFGATASPAQVTQQIRHAPDGAIVLMHMNHPQSGTAAGVRQAIEELHGQVRFVQLGEGTPA